MTPFQKKLKSHVWGYKAMERHWFVKDGAPRLVRVPSTGEQVTLRRAVYAAFRADIPAGIDLRTGCGARGCIAPDHQELSPTRTDARSLCIPDLVDPDVESRPNKLPKGLTFAVIAKIKMLGNSGSSLSSICSVTGFDASTVMKVRAGVYDRAAASVRRGVAVRLRNIAAAKESPVLELPEPSEPREESDYPEVDDAEVEAWLRSIR